MMPQQELRRPRRWGRRVALALLLAWAGYKLTTTRPVAARLYPPPGRWQDDPGTVADMSPFAPGAPPVRCQPWDTGRGLAGYYWPAPRPRAVLLLQAGWGDYALRYVNHSNRLIPELLHLGISVYAFDMWGAGYSPGPPGATSVADAVDDHLAARRLLAAQPLPVFVLGHSMGGLVTATSALREPGNLRGVVLLAPGLHYETSVALRTYARAMNFLLPTANAPVPPGELAKITQDTAAVRQLAQDQVFFKGHMKMVTAATGAIVSHANWPHYAALRAPLLVIHGTQDFATDFNGSRACVQQAASPDKTFYPVAGGYHALLDDVAPVRAQTLAELRRWLQSRL